MISMSAISTIKVAQYLFLFNYIHLQYSHVFFSPVIFWWWIGGTRGDKDTSEFYLDEAIKPPPPNVPPPQK